MSLNRLHRVRRFFALLLAAPLLTVCGGSSDGSTGPSGGETQTASATTTPASATVARGVKATTTVVFSQTGGLVIGNTYSVNRQYEGISVIQTSFQKTSSLITFVYEISADATVPAGVHNVYFSTPVTGYTGSGTSPSASTKFTLTVNP